MINTVCLFSERAQYASTVLHVLVGIALTKTRNACIYTYIFIYIHIYFSIYVYIPSRYVKYIYLRCMQAVLSVFNVISERARLIKNVLFLLLLLSSLLALSAPSSTQTTCLSMLHSCKPPSSPLFPYSLRYSSSPPAPLSPLSTSSFPPLPVPTSLCLRQTAQCEDGAEETQWSGQHLSGPGKGKCPICCNLKMVIINIFPSVPFLAF